MNRASRVAAAGLLVSGAAAAPALAGGAWVPPPGHGYVYLGFSRKTAGSSWAVDGHAYDNVSSSTGKVSWHDFRYLYLFGEVGVFRNFW